MIFILVCILGQLVLSLSVFGSRVVAVGDTVEAARLGAILLGAFQNAFVLLHLSPLLQQLSVGLVTIFAALFDRFRQGAYVPPRWLGGKRIRRSKNAIPKVELKD